jgi:hypothetical protein
MENNTMNSLTNKKEIEGVWWLKENPDEKLAGKMIYLPGDFIKLELIEAFVTGENNFPNHNIKYIIHGISKDGKFITMFNCFVENYQMHFPGFSECKFSSNSIFIGAHFNNESETLFKTVSFRFFNLENWVDISGFIIKREWESKIINMTYQLPESLKIYSNNKFNLWLDFNTESINFNHVYQKEFSISQYVELRIEFLDNTCLDKILELLNSLVRFYSLVITKPIYIQNISLVCNINEHAKALFDKFSTKILYFNTQTNILQNNEITEKRDMLFSYTSVKDNFQNILDKWLLNCEKLEPVFNLYFSTIFNTKLYTNDIFLNLIHAIESYHRRIYGNNEILEEECVKRVNELVLIKPEYKDWLKIRLKYAYELTLRKRLKMLFNEYEFLFSSYINDLKDFSDRLTDTRNYYTHFDENLKQFCFESIELYYASIKLKILLIACFLKEIGFNNEDIFKMIKENENYGFELTNHKF